jgi:hypothetical protein
LATVVTPSPRPEIFVPLTITDIYALVPYLAPHREFEIRLPRRSILDLRGNRSAGADFL